jgi:hypothetical protein
MLVTNGCSFVWGDELDGYEDNQHEHLAFPYLLSKHLDIPLTNLATCGACNQKIFRDTIDHLSKHDDVTHMVIIWSAWQRHETAESHPTGYEEQMKIQRWQCMTQISPSRLDYLGERLSPILDRYYNVVESTRDGIISTVSYMDAMKVLCEAKGIKLIQGIFHERMWVNYIDCFTPKNTRELNWGEYNDWIKRKVDSFPDHHRLGMGKYTDLFKLARTKYKIKPFGHPCEDTHHEYAELLHHIYRTTKF